MARHTGAMRTHPLAALLTGLLLAPAQPLAPRTPAEPDRPVCQRLERDLDRLRARLRHGVSARQDTRYRSRMKRLKTRYYNRCHATER